MEPLEKPDQPVSEQPCTSEHGIPVFRSGNALSAAATEVTLDLLRLEHDMANMGATFKQGQAEEQNLRPPFVMERYGRLSEMDRSFDIEYWQRLGPQAIFEAAWQMAVDAHSRNGGTSDELRLRRTVEHFSTQTALGISS